MAKAVPLTELVRHFVRDHKDKLKLGDYEADMKLFAKLHPNQTVKFGTFKYCMREWTDRSFSRYKGDVEKNAVNTKMKADEKRPTLKEVAEKLRGKELFPAKVDRAKKMLTNAKIAKAPVKEPLSIKEVKRAGGVAKMFYFQTTGILHHTTWARN
jgi:hypothetical protein